MFKLWTCILIITNASNSFSDKNASLIVRGVEAYIGTFPFAAWLSYRGRYQCGASILNNRMVLTAAHCKGPGGPQNFLVFVGSHFLKSGKPYKVCKFVANKEYDAQTDTGSDIAIVLLKSNIAFNQHTQPARLPIHNKWRDERLTFNAIGFGETESTAMSPRLLMTNMHFVNSEDCAKTYLKTDVRLPIPEHMFCLIGRKNNGPCYGDSGSAVVWKNLVVGLLATLRVHECGSMTAPTMYEDLFFSSKWIKRTVRKLKWTKCTNTNTFLN